MDREPRQRTAIARTAAHGCSVDHVALAVESLSAAAVFQQVLGAQFLCAGDNEDTGIRLLPLALPGSQKEVLT